MNSNYDKFKVKYDIARENTFDDYIKITGDYDDYYSRNLYANKDLELNKAYTDYYKDKKIIQGILMFKIFFLFNVSLLIFNILIIVLNLGKGNIIIS